MVTVVEVRFEDWLLAWSIALGKAKVAELGAGR